MVSIITANDGIGNLMAERRVRFTNEWNKKVIITGKLFGPEIDPHFWIQGVAEYRLECR